MAVASAKKPLLIGGGAPMVLPFRRIARRRDLPTYRASSYSPRFRKTLPGCIGAPMSNVPARFSGGTDSYSEDQRPQFDLNLAVVLAGFAFEAYSSPPDGVGWRETDAAECETIFLSEQFLREVYDGQLYIKLKKGTNFPAMDPWGTSDPYVVLQMDGQSAKTNIKWATKDPVWNEELIFNIKKSRAKMLKVEAWDANLVTPHKRMGNASVELDSLCDGSSHEVAVELGGIGGGGTIHLEVIYKSFDDIERDKQWWIMPFISDLLARSNFGSILKRVIGSDSISASDFVKSAFGQLNSFRYAYISKPTSTEGSFTETEKSEISSSSTSEELPNGTTNCNDISDDDTTNLNAGSSGNTFLQKLEYPSIPPDEYFWNSLRSIINDNVIKNFGFSLPEINKFDGLNLLSSLGLQLQQIAEEQYLASGLATASNNSDDSDDQLSTSDTCTSDRYASKEFSILDMRKLSLDVLSQTETIFGALMVLSTFISQPQKDSLVMEKRNETISYENEKDDDSEVDVRDEVGKWPDKQGTDDMRQLFSSAESAMEAWAMLSTSLGRNSFIKSDFQKISFLDNASTDTQVAIWRDSLRRRLVISFRGTEQAKWKDLRTDLMLIPAGLNPERIGGDFKNEVQVHSGFLNAYDSVRNRIMTLVKHSIGYNDDEDQESLPKWHLYVTGHSLGGALATLLALELSSSLMSRNGVISVTMYNFGSPRVGNRRFAEVYNANVRDSWRVVNHRDIIPTVPRLMGYCHVAQPIYLAVGDIKEALASMEVTGDGYGSDLIGESTPDVLVTEFMKGEMQLIEKILETEISLLRAIRDGSALMQHMEDFYYVTLLESVKTKYQVPEDSRKEDRQLTA